MKFFQIRSEMRRFRIVSLILVLVLAVSLFAGCGGDKTTDTTKKEIGGELTWVVVGTEAADNPRIFEMFNEKLKEKTNLTVNFEYIDQQQYDLKFAAGDSFDLILCPDWLGYWQNASKGAFMELKEEDFKTYTPYIWKNGKEQLNAAMFEGKYYGIPGIEKVSPNRTLVARGDLMDKLKIESLDTIDDIDAYLMGVADLNKKGETNIVPYNSPGNAPWMVFSMFASDWGWAAPGSLSYGGHYYYDIHDQKQKLFLAVDKKEVKEYSDIVKKWYDNGVFSKSILSNTTSAEEAYKNGKSAFAWTGSPATANLLYNDLKKISGADKWDTRFYSMYTNYQKTYNYLSTAVAVSATSKNKENALSLINTLYEDKELYLLLVHGIEGEHYEVDENGEYIPKSENYISPTLGIVNQAYKFPTKYDYPYALDLVAEMEAISVSDPTVNCPIQSEGEAASMKVKLDDIFKEYSQPRMYGAVESVDAALKREKDALKVAGVDKYLKVVQAQVDEYVKTHPEAMKALKEGIKKADDYRKANPHKVDPRKYK